MCSDFKRTSVNITILNLWFSSMIQYLWKYCDEFLNNYKLNQINHADATSFTSPTGIDVKLTSWIFSFWTYVLVESKWVDVVLFDLNPMIAKQTNSPQQLLSQTGYFQILVGENFLQISPDLNLKKFQIGFRTKSIFFVKITFLVYCLRRPESNLKLFQVQILYI